MSSSLPRGSESAPNRRTSIITREEIWNVPHRYDLEHAGLVARQPYRPIGARDAIDSRGFGEGAALAITAGLANGMRLNPGRCQLVSHPPCSERIEIVSGPARHSTALTPSAVSSTSSPGGAKARVPGTGSWRQLDTYHDQQPRCRRRRLHPRRPTMHHTGGDGANNRSRRERITLAAMAFIWLRQHL